MSTTPLISIIEPDGTLRYDCGENIAVRVALHRRNGTKRCPVELVYKNEPLLATDSNLRDLRDIESLLKHASSLLKDVPWHEILTAVARILPEHSQAPWTVVGNPLSAYAMERKLYVWYPVLPKGEPVSLEGDPGMGKSAVLVKLISHLTSGTAFPTLFADHPEPAFAPQTVILFTAEDDPHTTIRPRVEINSGASARVQLIEGKRDPQTGAVVPMTLQDLALLDSLLQTHAPALMAFDPIQSFFGSDVDMNRASETRPILDAVRDLCKARGCTPLYVRHHGKSPRSKAMHSALGSIDITAHMRSVLTLFKDPDDEQRRILAQTKTNGRWAPSMKLRLVGQDLEVETDAGTLTVEDVRVDWDGKSEFTAEVLNDLEVAHGNDTDEANSALNQAREFLREMLDEGPVLVDELRSQAKKAGITEHTLRRAKDKEKVKATRHATDGTPYTKRPWVWHLPGDIRMHPEDG
jgi:RecA-family ATPase